MSIPNLTYSANLLITAPKIDADFLWDLSMVFIGLALIYVVGVFFYRNKISATSKKVGDRKRELSPMISEFLFLEDDATKDEKSNYIALKIEIRQLLKDPFNRKVLSEVLLDLRKDVSGDAQQSLFDLYQDLGLHKDAFAKLEGWRWHVISKGILELTQMEVADSYGFITKFINDKRSTIRKQAEIATVTLRHEGISYFLDTTKYRISEWQQLKLLDVIRNKEDFRPPRFKAWLTSNNKYVVLFALRLIKYYNQNDASPSLIELVKHKNNQIKEEAIACIKEFHVTEALDTLKLVFWNCSIDVKIAILDAIAEIGTDDDIEFLNLIDKKELNFSVKSKALSSINAISPESIMPSKGIQDESRYKIPKDITEAVAKIHAKKHEEISGQKEEELLYVEETEFTPIEEEHNEIHEIEEEKIPGLVDEEIAQTASLSEEIETPTPTVELKNHHDIEVCFEEITVKQEIAMESKIDKKEFDDTEWDVHHLNFLPIVVEENEVEQKSFEISDHRSLVAMEELFNIPVVHEELMPDEKDNESQEDSTNDDISFFEEFNVGELAFLPVVVDNELEIKDAQAEAVENEKTGLTNFLVNYEEVHSQLLENEESVENLSILSDSESLHELKDIDLGEHSTANSNLDYKRYNTRKILSSSVVYEEVQVGTLEREVFEIEVIEPQILSEESKPEQALEVTFKQEEDHGDIELPDENEQRLQKIIDDLIAFDSPQVDEGSAKKGSFDNPDWDLDEDYLDIIPVSFEKEENEPPKYIKIEKIQKNSEEEDMNIPRASIPKAIFGDIEFEASTRQLLNDLEEMGDQREIPFLKELLNHEKYELFKNRINTLIDTFNHREESEKLDDPLQPFSVFQDLFRTCDNESKLILLNEMVEVGDEKEIGFLEDLTKDDSPEIRRKALEVLKGLKAKLAKQQNELETEVPLKSEVSPSNDLFDPMEVSEQEPSSDPNDIFDLNFDFTQENDENEDEKKKIMKNEGDEEQLAVQYGSFFGQICSFSHKIMEKLNG